MHWRLIEPLVSHNQAQWLPHQLLPADSKIWNWFDMQFHCLSTVRRIIGKWRCAKMRLAKNVLRSTFDKAKTKQVFVVVHSVQHHTKSRMFCCSCHCTRLLHYRRIFFLAWHRCEEYTIYYVKFFSYSIVFQLNFLLSIFPAFRVVIFFAVQLLSQ